jgi:hypothetical protein
MAISHCWKSRAVLEPAQFDKSVLENLKLAQQNTYPKTLKRGQFPDAT